MEFNDKAAFVTAEHPVSEKIVPFMPTINSMAKKGGQCYVDDINAMI